METKPSPNRRIYIETLRRMSPEERLAKAFELTDLTRELFRQGLRRRFPDLGDQEFQALYVERLLRCRNRPC